MNAVRRYPAGCCCYLSVVLSTARSRLWGLACFFPLFFFTTLLSPRVQIRMVFQRWLFGAPGDFRRLGAFGVTGACVIVGGALSYRQRHLRSSPIVDAATAQVTSADAVITLLGGRVASTGGMVGGYTDPVQGTAVITVPIVSESGVRAIARAEAEAEWVGLKASAEARGEAPPEHQVVAENCRWLVRHLEVELVEPPASSPNLSDDAPSSSLVLYSLPANVPLSAWAPDREVCTCTCTCTYARTCTHLHAPARTCTHMHTHARTCTRGRVARACRTRYARSSQSGARSRRTRRCRAS